MILCLTIWRLPHNEQEVLRSRTRMRIVGRIAKVRDARSNPAGLWSAESGTAAAPWVSKKPREAGRECEFKMQIENRRENLYAG